MNFDEKPTEELQALVRACDLLLGDGLQQSLHDSVQQTRRLYIAELMWREEYKKGDPGQSS